MESLQLLPFEPLQKVILRLEQDCKSFRGVHIFAHRLVIEANCQVCYCADMVRVVEAIMSIVVADSRDADCKNIHLID